MQKKEKTDASEKSDFDKAVAEVKELLTPVRGTCPYCSKQIDGDLALEIHIKRCYELNEIKE